MGEAMNGRLVLIHTVPPLIEIFNRLGARLQAHVDAAQRIHASAVLVTCSTLSPALDLVQATIPLFKSDQAMIEQAVQCGTHDVTDVPIGTIAIGLLATNQTTLEPDPLGLAGRGQTSRQDRRDYPSVCRRSAASAVKRRWGKT